MRRPSPPTTSPTKRIFTTGHTLAQSRERRRHGDSDFEGHDPLDGEPPPSRPRRSSSRAGCSWSCCRSASWRCGSWRARPGRVLLIFIAAGIVALILNPLVTFFQRGLRYRGLAVAAVYFGFFGFLGPGRLPARPTRWPTRPRASSEDVPGIIDSANQNLADLQDWLDDKGINLKVKEQGADRAADAAGQGRRRHQRHRVVRRRPREDDRHRGLRADPRLHPLDLHAHLRRADRRGRAIRDAAGRRDAGGRLPDARAARRRGLRPRAAAVQRRDGHRRRARACTSSASSGSSPRARRTRSRSAPSSGSWSSSRSSGPFLGALPPVLVALFQDPLTALWVAPAVPRPAAARGPRRRAATSSATRCGSTRCS